MDVHDYPILAWSDLCHLIMQPTCIHYWNKAIDCSNSHGPCNTAKPYKTKKKPSCLGLGRRVPARTCYVGSLALLAGLHGLGHGGWLAAGLLWTKLLFSSSFELGYFVSFLDLVLGFFKVRIRDVFPTSTSFWTYSTPIHPTLSFTITHPPVHP